MVVHQLYSRMLESLGVEDLHIPVTYVRLYRYEEPIPEQVASYLPEGETVMACQATHHAALGEPVLLTKESIGCVAAAISLGMVDCNSDTPFEPLRVYTDIMREQSGTGSNFTPPSPKEFTTGVVYACRAANRPEYCLFGREDSGRFKDLDIANKAVSEMAAIQPPMMKGVFFYSSPFDEIDIVPDVIVLSVRPVELTRIVQGYQYATGEPIRACMNAVRAVNSDLIARPYLTQEINVSPYCLGSRMVARFAAERLGVGIPLNKFELLVEGMEASKTGYPFQRYPGATDMT